MLACLPAYQHLLSMIAALLEFFLSSFSLSSLSLSHSLSHTHTHTQSIFCGGLVCSSPTTSLYLKRSFIPAHLRSFSFKDFFPPQSLSLSLSLSLSHTYTHTHTHTLVGSCFTAISQAHLALPTMQITDHSKEQVLLGVQRLRTMASSAASCLISPQPKASLNVATDLSMSLSSSSKPIKSNPSPPPMQLDLLPLYPSPSMVRSQHQASSSPASKLFFARGHYDMAPSSFLQASRGSDLGVNPSFLQTSMGLSPSLMQASIGLNPSLMPSLSHSNKGVIDVGANPSMHIIPHANRGVDIDVNQVPSSSDSDEEEGEDEGGYPSLQLSESINNNGTHRGSFSAIDGSPISLKRDREKMGSDNNNNNSNNMYEVSSRASDEEENASTRKKLRLSKEQSALLEESFKEHSTLNPKQKNALAKQLNLRPRQVEVWFQNRRARTKLKQTEVDCELLKRCCESLTEENRRLQKEVQELRALKVGAPCVIAHDFYMPLPAATLTMCPSCERVATLDSAPRPSKQHPALAFNPHHPQPSAAC